MGKLPACLFDNFRFCGNHMLQKISYFLYSIYQFIYFFNFIVKTKRSLLSGFFLAMNGLMPWSTRKCESGDVQDSFLIWFSSSRRLTFLQRKVSKRTFPPNVCFPAKADIIPTALPRQKDKILDVAVAGLRQCGLVLEFTD